MKISKLIEILEIKKKNLGDLEVLLEMMTDYNISTGLDHIKIISVCIVADTEGCPEELKRKRVLTIRSF